jgi:hypothetical protein
MKDKAISVLKGHKLLLVFLAAALIKQILVIGLPIYVMQGSPCDDELMKEWAFSISKLDWTGDFNSYTFMKEPGFAIFLAVCYRLHLPYIFTLTLGYSISCMVFSSALENIFSSKKSVIIIYIALLFHPISYCSTVLQRVYRNGLGVVLALCVFGGLLHLYFTIGRESIREPLLWSAFTGLSLGYLWITKSDTVWVLPFTGTVCLVMFFLLIGKRRELKILPRCLCLLFPILGILLCSSMVKLLNIQRYGATAVEYYGEVMDDLTHIKSGRVDEKIPLTRKQLRGLYDISPTLASVRAELEIAMSDHSEYDTNPHDGEVEAGWLGWAFVRGFSEAGVYEDCETANTFYKNIYEELEAAFASGRLERIEIKTAEKYYIDTPEHCRELAGRTLDAIAYMASYQRTRARAFVRKRYEGDYQDFEQLTRNKAASFRHKHDHYIAGWILFPEYDGIEKQIYVEDEEGNRYNELEFEKSDDVYEYLEKEGSALEDARNCHFKESWDVAEGKKDTRWYLSLYVNGQREAKILIERGGFTGEGNVKFNGLIDTYTSQKDEINIENSSRKASTRMNSIGSLYRAGKDAVFWLGMISYIGLTVAIICDLRKKRFAHGNAWLIVTGLGLSVLVLAAGIALVDLTKCPAVNTMYLSCGYPILMGAQLISICKCAELAAHVVRGIKSGRELNE